LLSNANVCKLHVNKSIHEILRAVGAPYLSNLILLEVNIPPHSQTSIPLPAVPIFPLLKFFIAYGSLAEAMLLIKHISSRNIRYICLDGYVYPDKPYTGEELFEFMQILCSHASNEVFKEIELHNEFFEDGIYLSDPDAFESFIKLIIKLTALDSICIYSIFPAPDVRTLVHYAKSLAHLSESIMHMTEYPKVSLSTYLDTCNFFSQWAEVPLVLNLEGVALSPTRIPTSTHIPNVSMIIIDGDPGEGDLTPVIEMIRTLFPNLKEVDIDLDPEDLDDDDSHPYIKRLKTIQSTIQGEAEALKLR
jgi:hypothetical protein